MGEGACAEALEGSGSFAGALSGAAVAVAVHSIVSSASVTGCGRRRESQHGRGGIERGDVSKGGGGGASGSSNVGSASRSRSGREAGATA